VVEEPVVLLVMEEQVVRVAESYLLAPMLYLSAGLFNLPEGLELMVRKVAVVVAPAAVSISVLTP